MEATVSRPDLFPDGTELAAYSVANWLTSDPPSGPKGTPTDEATVEEGTATFTELEADTDYYVGAEVNGVWWYVRVNTGAGNAVTGARDEPEGALKSLLEVLERKGLIVDGTTES